jgi:hypothetical protein
MAKFLNKKEQVFDLKLTSYGHYLMSIGKFKPAFYSFYDDNVIYDKKYAYSSTTENQNDINNRIKNNTQYIESLVLFRDTEETLNNGEGASDWYNQAVITARQQIPTKDIFKMDMPLGDALMEGNTNKAPSWKAISLQSAISSVEQTDDKNNSMIPQLNITSTYVKKAIENESLSGPDEGGSQIRNITNRTSVFNDGKVIILENDDPLYYIEEINTQLLTKNFDIEVFQILSSSQDSSYDQLERKLFKTKIPQVQNGFLVSETPKTNIEQELTTDDIEYYFDVLTDLEVDQQMACKAASFFNKKSYYVDLDFDCTQTDEENVFYDIYGSVTEPEVCLD